MKNLAILALSSAFLISCTDDDPAPTPTPTDDSIAGLAQQNPDLATLVAVADFAGNDGDLIELLSSPGTLTVFAPTNAAFDALAVELTGSAGAKATDLLKPENKPLLRDVLGYHVLGSEVTASAIPFGMPITASQNAIFKIEAQPPRIIDGRNRTAAITATDIDASNGVIHVVDRVILPADKNLVQIAQSDPQFSILVEAVLAADLAATLSAPGPLTVFAPTNAAFAALLGELGVTKDQLLADKPLLTKVLAYHVVPARVFKAQVAIGAPVATVQTGTFTIGADLGVTDARGRKAAITATDIQSTNGVIHVVDKVLLPAP
ncbi:MAG: fasciclin domain-containing protein [Myxococcales bacterium]|nr:fasciclin domain-containing protein [Myxococcales bacterium]